MIILMPWPPSANRYWRHVGYKTIISKEARDYKALVKRLALTWGLKQMTGSIELSIGAHPPDKRVRDLDNLLKITIDALKETGLFIDDSQIDRIIIERLDVQKPGNLEVDIREIGVPLND